MILRKLTPLETWDRVLDINLRGTFCGCHAAARVMLKKGSGVIIIFFRSQAWLVGRGANAYLREQRRGSMRDQATRIGSGPTEGIRVNAIAPCQFLTPGLKEVMAKPQVRPGEADAKHGCQYSSRPRG